MGERSKCSPVRHPIEQIVVLENGRVAGELVVNDPLKSGPAASSSEAAEVRVPLVLLQAGHGRWLIDGKRSPR